MSKRNGKSLSVAGVPLLFLMAPAAHGGPLPSHASGPFTAIFGVPDSAAAGRTLARGEHGFALSSITSSHNIDQSRSGESLRLDGESTRLALEYRYGLRDRLELSVEVPYLWHESGGLDSFIDDWHDFFGLPEGPRAVRDRDRLDFRYSGGGWFSLTDNARGLGDIRLGAGWRLSDSNGHATAIRLGLKLPTGDSARLTGSGGTDLSLGLAGDAGRLGGSDRWSGYYRADVTWLGEPDLLASRTNDVVGQLAGGLGYRLLPAVDLRAQARVRSAVYDSAIEALGGVAVTLSVGASFRLSDRYELALAVGEDVNPDSAPDVSFQVGLRYVGR